MAVQSVLPRWRGFNLLGGFTMASSGIFDEDLFMWMSEWGFDFARLPLCYTLWTKPDDVYAIDHAWLDRLDKAIENGRKHGIHICLNFHRGPGYSVNSERKEPFNLWIDDDARRAFVYHWEVFARRYKGIASDYLSFNLLNEPAAYDNNGLTRDSHERVMRETISAIRAIDEARLIIIDGLSWGNEPCPELADTGVAQSCRAYAPMGISHYMASWVNSKGWPLPDWPLTSNANDIWNKERLAEFYKPWTQLAASGVGVHCGEGGAYNRTPHSVMLRWFEDVLEVLTRAGIGYALWNFIGSFGILDSDRSDVEYEDWYGHKLDRKLLELLKRY